MRLILSSLATAALALVASAAPAVEQTKDLPARFKMYMVTKDSHTNGLRVQYNNGPLHIPVTPDSQLYAIDAVFLGGRGRIALDRSVHKVPNINSPTNPAPWGDWNLMFFGALDRLAVHSEQDQATFAAGGLKFTVGTWVQDASGNLRLIGADGVLQPNRLKLCGEPGITYQFWWDTVSYLGCPEASFRVVAM